MGKYMKKSKITGDVAVMEVSQPTSLGLRTRAAKTLALQRLHSASSSPSPTAPDCSPFSYLQLRSRRLEKPPLLAEIKHHHKQQQKKQPDPEREPTKISGGDDTQSYRRTRAASRLSLGSVNIRSAGSASVSVSADGGGCFSKKDKMVGANGNSRSSKGFCEVDEDGEDAAIEASFGENNLDSEARDRSTRESTPCSLMRGSGTTVAPGSSTRRVRSTTSSQRVQIDMQGIIPTPNEMEEFFSNAEQQQQRLFMDKYNFDIVNDMPLPGRYEWVQVSP